ncbi:MAG: GNAT family N-acetyltransferase, partial [Anaerolineae bacterium]|nr:GNAT family N-acetyltransferase [Anaerolineae bacterium]
MLPKHPHIELDYAFTIRHAELDDIEIFYQLVKTSDSEFYGYTSTTRDELLAEWQAPEFDIARDTRLVFAPNGTLIGFSILFENKEMPVRPYLWSYVHPEWRRLGVGTAIIEWAQARAKENIPLIPEDARMTLTTGVYSDNQSAKDLLETLGFTTSRGSVNMIIELDTPPQKPTFPDNI